MAMLTERDGDRANHWLTVATVDPEVADADRTARPVWKPLHLQPVWAGAPTIGGEVTARLFAAGLCLPSGSTLTDSEVDEIGSLSAEALP